MANIKDVIKRFRSLSEQEKLTLDTLDKFISPDEKRIIRGFLKEKKLSIDSEPVRLGKTTYNLPKILSLHDDTFDLAEEVNARIHTKNSDNITKDFSTMAQDKIFSMIAPHIVGFEHVKKAVALQLFSPEHVHLLLLGDPGTGKTEILSSATEIAPISAMGLGSGTSGVGLSVSMRGKEVRKGLLPMANGGLCAIDELNLMQEDSRASLYNAMEKGFVSYDKGGESLKFDAKVSVLATANPKGDKFTGKTMAELKKQLPFDPALLSRFHLTFFVRKHSVDEFKNISKALLSKQNKKLSKTEINFLRNYIKKAQDITPSIPKKLQQEIVEFIGDIKENESDFLIEISPRTVVGFSRLAKAAARMELRSEVSEQDINLVKQLFSKSLSSL